MTYQRTMHISSDLYNYLDIPVIFGSFNICIRFCLALASVGPFVIFTFCIVVLCSKCLKVSYFTAIIAYAGLLHLVLSNIFYRLNTTLIISSTNNLLSHCILRFSTICLYCYAPSAHSSIILTLRLVRIALLF